MGKTGIKIAGGASLLLALASLQAQAQVMPPPQKAPRVPVKSELIAAGKTPLPTSRVLEGKAIVLDAERLKLGGYELRLFGIVPPQMSASMGPQARGVVDALAAGTTTCRIKDRDREGRLLALCQNEQRADFGMELLRRGLAVTARGSLGTSDYAAPYIAAEQAAQEQRLGLWANQTVSAASEKSIREAATKAAAAKTELARLKEEEAKARAEIEALAKAAPPAAQEAEAPQETEDVFAQAEPVDPIPQFNLSGDPVAVEAPAPLLSAQETEAPPMPSLVERYQLLITGLLFLLATLCVTGGVIAYKLRQKRDDLRALAAALRGELMAARSICQARLAKVTQEGDEGKTRWPRIRSTVFQAYVGRLGLLGADLSRQIASIYGQASDYASYYNTNDDRSEGASKRQALASLVNHIEEVTPRLSAIEKAGLSDLGRAVLMQKSSAPQRLAAPQSKSLPLPRNDGKSIQPQPPSGDPGGTPRPTPQPSKSEPHARKPLSPEIAAKLSNAKTELFTETAPPQPTATKTQDQAVKVEPKAVPPQQTQSSEKKQRPPLSERAIVKKPATRQEGIINFSAPLFGRLSKLKDKMSPTPPASTPKATTRDVFDFTIPDYANLTEEELEALLYAEDEFYAAPPAKKTR